VSETVSQELRELARQVGEVVSASRVASMAGEALRAFQDYLTLRAYVIDLDRERDRLKGENERLAALRLDRAGL
jgi:hypothetical protein